MRRATAPTAVWLSAVTVAVLILAVAVGVTQPWSGQALPALELPGAGRPFPEQLTWEWPGDLGAELPGSVLVYRTASPDSGLDRARELAGLFDIPAQPFRAEGRAYAAVDGRRCWVNRDGTFSYLDDARWPHAEISFNLTSAELAELATGYLRSRSLLPAEFSVWSVEPATISYADSLGEQIVGWTVMFRRRLNGLPVLGASSISVDVTEVDGLPAVVGVSSYWRPMNPYRELPLRSVTEAVGELVRGAGAIDMPELAVSAQINDVSLAYWEHPVVDEQPYLQPVYHFTGWAELNDGRVHPFSGSVPALCPSVIARSAARQPAAALPVIPDDLPAEAWRIEGDERVSIPESVAPFARALSRALSGATVEVVGDAPYDSVVSKLTATDSAPGLDIIYEEPVQLAVKLDRADSRTVVDAAGRAVLVADRLLVYWQGEYVYLGCLNRQSNRGQILRWQRSPQTLELEGLGSD